MKSSSYSKMSIFNFKISFWLTLVISMSTLNYSFRKLKLRNFYFCDFYPIKSQVSLCATICVTFQSPKIFQIVLYFLFFLHRMPSILLSNFISLTFKRIGTVFSVRYELKCVYTIQLQTWSNKLVNTQNVSVT